MCGCYCCLKTTTVGNDGVLKELPARIFSADAAGVVCESNSQIPGKKTEIDNKMGCQRLERERERVWVREVVPPAHLC